MSSQSSFIKLNGYSGIISPKEYYETAYDISINKNNVVIVNKRDIITEVEENGGVIIKKVFIVDIKLSNGTLMQVVFNTDDNRNLLYNDLIG